LKAHPRGDTVEVDPARPTVRFWLTAVLAGQSSLREALAAVDAPPALELEGPPGGPAACWWPAPGRRSGRCWRIHGRRGPRVPKSWWAIAKDLLGAERGWELFPSWETLGRPRAVVATGGHGGPPAGGGFRRLAHPEEHPAGPAEGGRGATIPQPDPADGPAAGRAEAGPPGSSARSTTSRNSCSAWPSWPTSAWTWWEKRGEFAGSAAASWTSFPRPTSEHPVRLEFLGRRRVSEIRAFFGGRPAVACRGRSRASRHRPAEVAAAHRPGEGEGGEAGRRSIGRNGASWRRMLDKPGQRCHPRWKAMERADPGAVRGRAPNCSRRSCREGTIVLVQRPGEDPQPGAQEPWSARGQEFLGGPPGWRRPAAAKAPIDLGASGVPVRPGGRRDGTTSGQWAGAWWTLSPS